jgi:hypothetical protein
MRFFRLWFSGLCQSVVLYVDDKISEESADPLFRILEIEAVSYLETLVSTYKTTGCYNQKIPQLEGPVSLFCGVTVRIKL